MRSMKITKITYLLMSLLLIIFSTINVSLAEDEGIHFGRIKITPRFDFESRYDSNVFLSSKNEIADNILSLKPDFSMKYLGNNGNHVTCGYKLTLVSYLERNDNNYQSHSPYLTFSINTPMGFYLKFKENYTKTADPYGSENTYGKGNRTSRWKNDSALTVGYQFYRGGFELLYNNKLLRYDDTFDQWQESTDNELNLKIFANISRKISAILSYKYVMTEYDQQNSNIQMGNSGNRWSSNNSQDASLNNVLVGFRFEPGGKITGEAKIGYGSKDFDNESDYKNRSYEDLSTWVTETKLSYRPNIKSELKFRFERKVKGAPDDDASSIVITDLFFNLKQKVMEKVHVLGELSWGNADYRDEYSEIAGVPRPNKYLNEYGISCALEYEIQRYINATLEFAHTIRNASHSKYLSYEFEKNEVVFMVSGKL